MRGWASCAFALTMIACGGSKGAPDAAPSHADAPGTADAPSTADAPPPPTDAMPSSVHTYYLNFEGQALTPGADDPATNTSTIPSSPYTVPPYLMNDAQRTTKIAALVAEVSTILAPYDVTITTTRPATGPYDMMVAGGMSNTVPGLGPGIGSITSSDCNANHQHVMVLFELVTEQHAVASQIIAMLGVAQALPQTTKAGDCLCYASQTCTSPTAACTIGGPNTPVFTDQACNKNMPTMDENSEWLAVFGPHP